MEKLRAYILYDEGKTIDDRNIDTFDFDLLKNAIGIHTSDVGAFGIGGLVYVFTEEGNEYLFKFFNSQKMWDILSVQIPMLKENNDNWEMMSDQVGWRFFVRKDYEKKLLSACKDYLKTSEVYQTYKENGKVSEEDILYDFIIPHNGPSILHTIVEGEVEYGRF